MWRHSFGVMGGAGSGPQAAGLTIGAIAPMLRVGGASRHPPVALQPIEPSLVTVGRVKPTVGGTVFHLMERQLTRDRGGSRAFQCVTGVDPLRS